MLKFISRQNKKNPFQNRFFHNRSNSFNSFPVQSLFQTIKETKRNEKPSQKREKVFHKSIEC